MNYYRITLEDGTYHYMMGTDWRKVKKDWKRSYSHLSPIKSIRKQQS